MKVTVRDVLRAFWTKPLKEAVYNFIIAVIVAIVAVKSYGVNELATWVSAAAALFLFGYSTAKLHSWGSCPEADKNLERLGFYKDDQ